MKTIKILFACFFAVAIGAGVSAFTGDSGSKEEKVTRGAGQYRYTEATDNISDLQSPGHWVLVSGAAPSCPNTGDIPCYVNYTGSDFDSFLSVSDLDDLMGIAVKIKEVEP
ncbi:MAG: hypothetical protein EOO06_05470 [Chitinophagaceae bacterium]|nr:MAG: hypothetical protein EOO06_05470 [Chitinophagaceae bacterium]